MRQQILFLARAVFLLAPLLTTTCVVWRSRALAAARQQSEASVAPSSTKDLPSTEWADKLRELAEKLASVCAPPAKIEFAVINMSSLRGDEVAAIGDRLRTQLVNRRFHIVDAASPDADLAAVDITLSEGVEGYVVVAKVRREAADQVLIVTVPKSLPGAKATGEVALTARFVWDQPVKILDFALSPPSTEIGGATSTGLPAGDDAKMIVLEPGRIAFYARKGSQWQLNQAVIIPPLRPWLRAPRGRLDLSRGLASGIARLPGIDCKGDFARPDTIECGFVDQDAQSWNGGGDNAVPFHGAIGGESVALSLECEGRPVALATGFGDSTQPDFIQAFEMGFAKNQGGSPSGKPIEFEGPVTFPQPAGSGAVASAIAQNLKTGNYEAYIVTATCSH
jgi:hypothetical protein